jgi:hypothetical protein
LLRQHGIAFTEHPYAFSLFATRRAMPVFVEEKILALPRIVINGGRRGHWWGWGRKCACSCSVHNQCNAHWQNSRHALRA